jgi:alcohol dehydrogenase
MIRPGGKQRTIKRMTMNNLKDNARELLRKFKGENYVFGNNCLSDIGNLVGSGNSKVSLVVRDVEKAWKKPYMEVINKSLSDAGIELAGEVINGAAPNAPHTDVFRIADELEKQEPGIVITIGAGSNIDATKAAVAYWILKEDYSDLDAYFGMNTVTEMLAETNKKLPEIVAVQWAASSAAHLTKYSNITDITKGQKMLIVDNALVPGKSLFDYNVTKTQPTELTRDGGLDGISHCLEVLMGIPDDKFEIASEVCLTGIELIVNNIKAACDNPEEESSREAIGLGTDLGGYAIMIGGTNGAHLNSFSLTEILPHGRACALMNPYYVVFFSPAIEKKLAGVAEIFNKAGYFKRDYNKLKGRDLGLAVAEAMLNLSEEIGFPKTLNDVKGFSDKYIQMCLTAAKNPKLDSKLKNMPVPLSADTIDDYMAPILEAAKNGNFSLIKNV